MVSVIETAMFMSYIDCREGSVWVKYACRIRAAYQPKPSVMLWQAHVQVISDNYCINGGRTAKKPQTSWLLPRDVHLAPSR